MQKYIVADILGKGLVCDVTPSPKCFLSPILWYRLVWVHWSIVAMNITPIRIFGKWCSMNIKLRQKCLSLRIRWYTDFWLKTTCQIETDTHMLPIQSARLLPSPNRMEAYWSHGVQKKSTYPNYSGALTNGSGRLITVPEDILTAPEHFRNCSIALTYCSGTFISVPEHF